MTMKQECKSIMQSIGQRSEKSKSKQSPAGGGLWASCISCPRVAVFTRLGWLSKKQVDITHDQNGFMSTVCGNRERQNGRMFREGQVGGHKDTLRSCRLVVEAARSPLHVGHPLPIVQGQINQTFVRPRSALRLHGLAQRHRQAIIMYAEAANHVTTIEVHVGACALKDQIVIGCEHKAFLSHLVGGFVWLEPCSTSISSSASSTPSSWGRPSTA